VISLSYSGYFISSFLSAIFISVDAFFRVFLVTDSVRVYMVGYIFCIIDYHICRDIFSRLYILYNRLPYMSGYIW
jgi:hypothetical protein